MIHHELRSRYDNVLISMMATVYARLRLQPEQGGRAAPAEESAQDLDPTTQITRHAKQHNLRLLPRIFYSRSR